MTLYRVGSELDRYSRSFLIALDKNASPMIGDHLFDKAQTKPGALTFRGHAVERLKYQFLMFSRYTGPFVCHGNGAIH